MTSNMNRCRLRKITVNKTNDHDTKIQNLVTIWLSDEFINNNYVFNLGNIRRIPDTMDPSCV